MTKHNRISAKTTLNIRGKLVSLEKPVVMGILNLTPDSFYVKSRKNSVGKAIQTAGEMLNKGAVFLDLGGYSSRPGAKEVSEKEELARVIPVIKGILTAFPEALISVDTFRASIARRVIDLGAAMINDISGGADAGMYSLIAETQTPYILMHMRGTITAMMDDLHYDNLLGEMTDYFNNRLQTMKKLGIKDIIIDPGFGFSKSLDQNYEILKNLAYFEALDTPILVGLSRKSMIFKLLNSTPEEALNGTNVLNFAALENGARILRVHDVKEAVETVELFSKLSV